MQIILSRHSVKRLVYLIVSVTATCAGMVNLTSTDGLSSYTASWRGRGDRVEFKLTGEGDGWVGIGFSHNRMMVKCFLANINC